MFNPAQVSSMLAKMSDPQLQSYAQMHKGDPYVVALALSESNRRQQMRSAVTPMPQQEQPKVVDQAVAGMAPQPMMPQQAQPMPEEQGIAQLPAPNIEGMRDGGIVGYAEGDVVQGSGVQEAADRRAILSTVKKLGAAGMDVLSLPHRGVAGAFESVVTRPLRAFGVPVPYLPESFYGGDRGSMTPYMDALARSEQGDAAPQYSLSDFTRGPQMSAAPSRFTLAREEPAPEKAAGLPAAAAASKSKKASASTSTRGVSGDPVNMSKKFVDQYFPEKDMPKVPTLEEAFAKQSEADKMAGVDPDLYKKQREELEAERQGIDKDKSIQANMRLIEIGLGIAGGTSQYALENIGKGAAPGLRGLMDDLKDFRKVERDLKKSERDLTLAQNQYNQQRSDKAQSRVERAQDRLDTLMQTRNKLAFDMGKTYVEQQGADRRTAMQMDRYGQMDARAERGERAKYFQSVADSADKEIKNLQSSPAAMLDKNTQARIRELSMQRDQAMATWAKLLDIQSAPVPQSQGNVIDFSALPSRR